jgi:putative component of toxin-antitoxin plasmid stabilization module
MINAKSLLRISVPLYSQWLSKTKREINRGAISLRNDFMSRHQKGDMHQVDQV